jgi:hypothetical protein
LIYVPFLVAMTGFVFLLARGGVLSGVMLAEGILTLLGECIIRLMVSADVWKENDYSGVVFGVMLLLAILLICYGIFTMTFWKPKSALEAEASAYDYIFQAKPEIVGESKSQQTPPVSAVGVIRGVTGEYAGESVEISAGEEIVLGRDPQYCMLIFSNPKVSRRQCGIRYDAVNGFYQAIDYSSNGTTLSDGTLLTTSEYTPLKPGTLICLVNGEEELLLE